MRLVCYLDCGPQVSDGRKGGPQLRLPSDETGGWEDRVYGGDKPLPAYYATMVRNKRINFRATGLDPKKSYTIGLSWWDFNHSGRRQSIEVVSGDETSTVRLLADQSLPAWKDASQPPQELSLPVPPATYASGRMRIAITESSGKEAVVSEIWLWEGP